MTHGEHEKAAKTEHTPEPWEWSKHKFNSPHFEGTLEQECGIYPPLGESGPVAIASGEANARRIVACVNACAGMTNEQIDNVCMISGSLLNRFGEQMAYLGQVEKQRDELLEELERIADPRNTHFAGDAQVVARAVIASVKEKQNAAD